MNRWYSSPTSAPGSLAAEVPFKVSMPGKDTQGSGTVWLKGA